MDDLRDVAFLVPARGGSKGLTRKNLRALSGKPLIQWTFDSINESSIKAVTYVSSDSSDILDIAGANGLQAIRRSTEASSDEALARDVVLDFLDKIPNTTKKNLTIIYLQPTSPLREGRHIDEAYSLFLESGKKPVVAIAEPSLSREKYVQLDRQKRIRPIGTGSPTMNRQSGNSYFYPNGAIYIFSVEDFLEQGDIPVKGSMAYLMDKRSSLDIDDAIDLLIAEGRKFEAP